MKDKIGESLHRLVHSYRSQVKDAAIKSGLSIPVSHIRSLKCIKNIENCSATDIASKLLMDKSQITRTLKELVNEGYVEKQTNPSNHRSQLLFLTDSGSALLTHLMTLEESTRNQMTAGLSSQQIDDFILIADTMRHNLQLSGPENTNLTPCCDSSTNQNTKQETR